MKKLLVYLKDYKKESVLAPLFKMLEAFFELLVPITVSAIIDGGINQGNSTHILAMCGIMLALGVVGLVSAISAQFFAAKAAVGFGSGVRSALFKKIQGFGYSRTDRLGTSTLITRMTSDINAVQTGVNMFLRLFMRSPFVVFGAMICAALIDIKAGIIFAATIVLLSIIVFGIMIISVKLHKKTQSELDRVVVKVRSSYTGSRVVRAFNRENSEIEEFEKRSSALNKIQLFAGKISALMNPVTYVIINAAVIIMIKSGALSVSSGDITQGELVALYNYMSQILVELIKLASLIITLNKALASANRISAVMDTPDDIDFTIGAQIDSEHSQDVCVRFDNVSFSYSESEGADPVITSLSFKVLRGQTVGIIGGTGSGKSTLANLITGAYHPTSGNVFVNGKNAALLGNTKKTFGIVPQRATLFSGTIRTNLQMGKESATDEEMCSALKIACADSFVFSSELGLEQAVTPGGRNFSGGQRQRLTIARALIRRPEILILDDSSSALDYATEAALRKNLASLDYSPTTFIISQRTSSIMHADMIIVLENGVTVGIGTHQELLASCEIYKEIYASQFSKGGQTDVESTK